MSTANGLKKQISKTIESLPESTLVEVATFLNFLEYRESPVKRTKETPYTPVTLGGLCQDVVITDDDIAEIRQEMWSNT